MECDARYNRDAFGLAKWREFHRQQVPLFDFVHVAKVSERAQLVVNDFFSCLKASRDRRDI